jgi:hypothetical protein
MAAVQDFFENVLDQEGPFDGVIGFSQGAEVVISYLWDSKRRDPLGSPPFRFAVLFSPVVAFSSDTSYCEEEISGITGSEFHFLKQTFEHISSHESLDQTRRVLSQTDDVCDLGLNCSQAGGQKTRGVLLTSLVGMVRAGAQSEALNLTHIQRCLST